MIEGRLSRLMRRAAPGELLAVVVLVADPPEDAQEFGAIIQQWHDSGLTFEDRLRLPRVGVVFIQADAATVEAFQDLPHVGYLSATAPDVFALFEA